MFSPKSPPMSGNCNYNCGGKCLGFVEIWFTFPGENGENGGRINISGGKVPQIPGKMVHFPGKNGKKRQEFPINSKSFLVPHNKKIPLFPA